MAHNARTSTEPIDLLETALRAIMDDTSRDDDERKAAGDMICTVYDHQRHEKLDGMDLIADMLVSIELSTKERIADATVDADAAYEVVDAVERRDPWRLADAIEAATHHRVPVALVPTLLGGPR